MCEMDKGGPMGAADFAPRPPPPCLTSLFLSKKFRKKFFVIYMLSFCLVTAGFIVFRFIVARCITPRKVLLLR